MRWLFGPLVVALVAIPQVASAAVVTINPEADTTIYEGALGNDPSGTMQDNSCGGGPDIFAGLTDDGERRRALLRFDVAGAVPAGSTINSVTVTLRVNRTQDNQNRTYALHPVTTTWEPGTVNCSTRRGGGQGDEANNGDATWNAAAHNQSNWTSAGGDFGAASATTSVPSNGGQDATWASTAALVSDVQTWLDSPGVNFGWIVIGPETGPLNARRFESSSGNPRPELTIDFTAPSEVFACCAGDGTCNVTDTTSCISGGGTPDTNTSSCDPNPCPQPTGACCNIDETCSANVAVDVCVEAGGIFQGDGVACNAVDCGLTPFVDLLPKPAVMQPVGTREDGAPIYEVTMSQQQQQLHSELPLTDVWTYNGVYPGPTIEVDTDELIEVKYINDLPPGSHYLAVNECPHGPNYWQDSPRGVVHLHGGHVPSRYDGQPELDFMPGEFDVYEYPNHQLPGTLWYHDHALGITRLNVYMGMSAFYLIRDDFERSLDLPTGGREIPMLIQDRQFNANGTLFYPSAIQNAFFGDKTLVNGVVWPYRNVQRGKYRLRLLNGAQARNYTLRLENQSNPQQLIPFHLIGTDGGLIEAPITLDTVSLAPAERLDVIVDFEGLAVGTDIILKNDDPTEPLIPNVMLFNVGPNPGFTNPIPASLRPFTPIPEGAATETRRFRLLLENDPCAGGEWLIQSLDDMDNVIGHHWDDITEFPVLGTTEIWEFENPSTMMHPMHVHLQMFQVLDKVDLNTDDPIPLEAWEENTWKDTVVVPPGTKVRIIIPFEDYVGKFAYHCHILDHEDHEMMRQFQTTSGVCNNNGICDFGEDCVSCADCGQVSGAWCGNGLCETGDGENCTNCPNDCAGGVDYCCGDDVTCADSRCTDGFFCRVNPRVAACCGDALCEGQEITSCGVDCSNECTREGNLFCTFFEDGFESGDTSVWSGTQP